MIKKFLVALSVMMCAFAVTACNDSSSHNEIQETTTLEPTSEDTNPVAGTDEHRQSKIPVISITNEVREWTSDNGEVTWMEVSMPVVTIENAGFEGLEQYFSSKWIGIDDNEFERLKEDAKSQYEFISEEERQYFAGYSQTEELKVTRCDEKIVSIREFYYEYTGGAHGNYAEAGLVLDTKTGVELNLEDVLLDANAFYEMAIPYIETELWRQYSTGLFDDYKEYVKSTFDGEREVNWYMDGTGIVLLYSPYEVGPYAMGTAEVTFPYSKFENYIKKQYRVSSEEQVVVVTSGNDFSKIANAPKMLFLDVFEDDNYMQNITLISGANRVEVGRFGDFVEAYLIRKDSGKCYLLLVCDYMSEDMVTIVYDVSNGDVSKCMELSGVKISGNVIASDRIQMSVYLDVLGTYVGSMMYEFEEDGMLIASDEVVTIESKTYLTIKKALPAMVEGKEVTIDAGRKIAITGTDNMSEVYFVTEDGKTKGTIIYERDSADTWQITINGVNENEYFEMLPYAG